jgi:hypothetical protein
VFFVAAERYALVSYRCPEERNSNRPARFYTRSASCLDNIFPGTPGTTSFVTSFSPPVPEVISQVQFHVAPGTLLFMINQIRDCTSVHLFSSRFGGTVQSNVLIIAANHVKRHKMFLTRASTLINPFHSCFEIWHQSD